MKRNIFTDTLLQFSLLGVDGVGTGNDGYTGETGGDTGSTTDGTQTGDTTGSTTDGSQTEGSEGSQNSQNNQQADSGDTGSASSDVDWTTEDAWDTGSTDVDVDDGDNSYESMKESAYDAGDQAEVAEKYSMLDETMQRLQDAQNAEQMQQVVDQAEPVIEDGQEAAPEEGEEAEEQTKEQKEEKQEAKNKKQASLTFIRQTYHKAVKNKAQQLMTTAKTAKEQKALALMSRQATARLKTLASDAKKFMQQTTDKFMAQGQQTKEMMTKSTLGKLLGTKDKGSTWTSMQDKANKGKKPGEMALPKEVVDKMAKEAKQAGYRGVGDLKPQEQRALDKQLQGETVKDAMKRTEQEQASRKTSQTASKETAKADGKDTDALKAPDKAKLIAAKTAVYVKKMGKELTDDLKTQIEREVDTILAGAANMASKSAGKMSGGVTSSLGQLHAAKTGFQRARVSQEYGLALSGRQGRVDEGEHGMVEITGKKSQETNGTGTSARSVASSGAEQSTPSHPKSLPQQVREQAINKLQYARLVASGETHFMADLMQQGSYVQHWKEGATRSLDKAVEKGSSIVAGIVQRGLGEIGDGR